MTHMMYEDPDRRAPVPVTADVPGWVHDPDDICERDCCGPTLPVTADVQRELAEACEARWPGAVSNRDTTTALLPTVRALIADAEKRAAAGALREVADWLWDDDVTTRSLCDQLHERADEIHPEPIRFEVPSRPSSLRGRAVPPRAAAVDPSGAADEAAGR